MKWSCNVQIDKECSLKVFSNDYTCVKRKSLIPALVIEWCDLVKARERDVACYYLIIILIVTYLEI